MDFYSRPPNARGETETIPEHTLKVASYAEQNANFFDKGYEAKIIGKFHDFGKYGILFQKVLLREEQKINHEAAGSLLMSKIYCNTKELQVVIEAHHKQIDYHCVIQDNQYFNKDYKDKYGRRMSIESIEEFRSLICLFNEQIGIDKEAISNPIYNHSINNKLEKMLYIRMMLSALVDADYTAASEHTEKNDNISPYAEKINSEQYLMNLLKFRDNIIKSSNANTLINKIRNEIFDKCISSAQLNPGLFTLTAPTGTGKTLSLLAFALAHCNKWKKRRIFIILPFLSIIEQNAAQYKEICPNLLEDHSQTEYTESTRLYSDRWNAEIIVTTSVKFFESLFKGKPPECRKLHNLSDSVIVFDEAQSLPHDLLGVSIETINLLCSQYNCTVLFSTATQPCFKYRKDLNWEPTEIINNIEDIYKTVKRVNINWKLETPMSFESIAIDMIRSNSCCTIVNVKKHAVVLFNILETKLPSSQDYLFHISSDMCVAHRKDIISKIKAKQKNNQPCLLVSTQCIEAGVDLDFNSMYRTLAPLESIIQSAGRCNRNGNNEIGNVVVFIPEEEKYPGTYYNNAANIVKLLVKEQGIDINNINDMDRYYSYLFKQFNADKNALSTAVDNMDFEEVTNQYQLIPNTVYNVIVPYENKIELFNEVVKDIRENGLSNKAIAKARPITVNTYYKQIEDVSERLYFKAKSSRQEDFSTNWFILLDSKFYDKNLGLQISNDINISLNINI
ncbi:MAG: CRISPR-associated helicase Cas3' [Clostridia bacterium]